MPLVTVRAHDPRIEYFGPNWKDDMFEIRKVDPPGGVNDTADGVCMLGVASRETWGFGNGFRLSFTGVGVRLVMQSRQDHGFYVVDVDGAESTVGGYSYAPHCGTSFVADGLPLGEHTVSATLTGRNPGSTWPDNYMQMFAIQYDPGSPEATPSPSNSNSNTKSTDQTPESTDDAPTPTTPIVPSASRKGISGGAIAGFAIAGVVVAFCVALLAVWLVRRGRRQRSAGHDGSENPFNMSRAGGGDVAAPYMLHPGTRSSNPSPSPSAVPDYVRNDSFSSSSASPYAAAPGTTTSYQPLLSSASPRPSGKALYTMSAAPPPPPEEGETMLPPYRSN